MGAEQSKPAKKLSSNESLQEKGSEASCSPPTPLNDEESSMVSSIVKQSGKQLKKTVDDSMTGKSSVEDKAKLAQERVSAIIRANNPSMQTLAANNPQRYMIVVAHIVAGLVSGSLASGVLALLGFTGAGIAAGSIAAAWQASIGSVAAGSIFAVLQGLGASGFVMLALAIAVPIVAIGFAIWWVIDWCKNTFGGKKR